MSSLGATYAHIAKSAKGPVVTSNVASNPVSSASSEQGTKNLQTQSDVQQSKAVKSSSKVEKETAPSPRGSINADETSRVEKFESINDHPKIAEKEDGNLTRETGTSATSPKSSTEEKRISATDAQDAIESQDKNRDNEEDWEKVSIPSSTTEKTEKDKEPKAAPPPAVNFWTQRMQQQAKQKEQTARQTVTSTPPQQSKPRQSVTSGEETKKKQNNRDANSGEPSSASTKNNTNARSREQQSNSTSPRSTSQQNENSVPRQLPPVDTESWPTPESAIVDSSRRSSAIDKLDKGDMAENKSSSRKAWQPLPFVPSVKFETQLPGTARRGGARTTNGRGRGAATNHGERNTEKSDAGSMAPPPLPKTVSEQDRGRRGNANNANRASSVPTENQRYGATEQQQLPVAVASASTKPSISEQSSSTATENATGTSTPPTQDPSRSSSRHTSAVTASKPPSSDRGAAAGPTDTAAESSSQSVPGEKPKVTPVADSLRNLDLTDKPANKEWQKERANNAQKSENWRSERRTSERTERGRGGSYRGRGNNHAAFNNTSFTSPLPQNAFEVPKQNAQADPRSRQPSQPFTSPYGSTRVNPRSQSIPLQMIPGGFYQPAPGFPNTLPPIQTDMNYPGYGQMPNIPGSVMSAMPYGDQLGGFALISMVVTQLEYYFSLDNLCKDMYLRKHMDSQGFVPLRVIAEFRRIKSLLGDNSMSYDQLRHVAQQVRNIEFVVGEDGEDRLRSRENWKDFVLPMEERLPQAQNDGPTIKQSRPRYSNVGVPDFHMTNGLRSAPPNVNGFQDSFSNQHAPQYQGGMFAEPHDHEQWASQAELARHDEERRTSVTSPLSKVQSTSSDMRSAIAGMTNGHRDSVSSSAAGKENTFPDEEVAKLKVVVKDPEYQNETDSTSDEPNATRVSGLRGSAGSPEQLERFRSLQFGQNGRSNSRYNEQTMYLPQVEAPAQYMQPGYIHEDYLSLKEKASSQRAENHYDGACIPLYPLWAEFLASPNSFNVGMYEDFKTWAIEDLENGNENGKKHLVHFYDAMLSGKNAMTERLATDIVNIARSEPTTSRPVWLKLRAAWRNGATNMKTRKRLTDLLTAEEKSELERRT